jgi:hypothetical protein
MPVIRIDTEATRKPLPRERRDSLLARLKDEWSGKSVADGPVVFEIPLAPNSIDVLVVWNEWAGVCSEDRANLIEEAYGDGHPYISQALGVTYEEAMQQDLLPYAVVSFFEDAKARILAFRADEGKKLADIVAAKRENGGIVLPDGKVDLRLPNRAMADNAVRKLVANEKYGDLRWSVSTDTLASGIL